jgi:hypothetical protein
MANCSLPQRLFVGVKLLERLAFNARNNRSKRATSIGSSRSLTVAAAIQKLTDSQWIDAHDNNLGVNDSVPAFLSLF